MTSPSDEQTAPQQLASLPRELLDAFALLKSHAPVQDSDVVGVPVEEVYPVAAAAVQAEQRKKAARQKAEKEAIRQQIGQQIGNEGIFCGQVSLLGRIFNLYAAPQNLTNASGKTEFKYGQAQECLATLESWNGHGGANYTTEEAVVKAMEDGSYNGEWLLPWRELVVGTDAKGNKVPGDNLCSLQNKIKDTFNGTYLTSTVRNNDNFVLTAQFPDGVVNWEHPNIASYPVRPVRLVLAPPSE